MISFNYEVDFSLDNEKIIAKWISSVIKAEEYKEDEVNYIFCNDAYLHKLNVEFLNHDTFTDVISFDYSVGKILQGDVFISIERVKENAKDFSVPFLYELNRVMVHGVLHYCGYNDKTVRDASLMRKMEDYYLNQLDNI